MDKSEKSEIIEYLNPKFASIDKGLIEMSNTYHELIEYLGPKFDSMDQRFEGIESRLEKVESGVSNLETIVFNLTTEVRDLNGQVKISSYRLDRLEHWGQSIGIKLQLPLAL